MAIHIQPAVYINGINRTSHTVMPIKWGNFLDERLDECRLSLRSVQQENFPPLTPVEIVFTITEYFGIWKKNPTIIKTKTETKRFIVANDSATEFRPKSGLYNHDLYLIEPTKVAECYVVDTITFTNDLGRSYTEGGLLAQPEWIDN